MKLLSNLDDMGGKVLPSYFLGRPCAYDHCHIGKR